MPSEKLFAAATQKPLDDHKSYTNAVSNNKIFSSLQKFSTKLDSFGVESRGIERVKPYERATDKKKAVIQVLGLWLAASGGLTSLSSFILGPLLFSLGLKDSFIYGTIGQFLGCILAAYTSIMGPRSGCRQFVSARYLFGWWFVKIVAIIGIIGGTGWSVTNAVLGGQILMSISDDKCPLEVGIVIVAVISLAVAIFGIKQLLRVETLLSFPILASFFLMYISMKGEYKYLHLSESIGDAATIKGHQLSFLAVSFSVTSTWSGVASDYYLVFPETAKDVEVFAITLLGIFIPTTFVSVAGLLLGNIAFTYPAWNEIYESNGLGGLITAAYAPWGRGTRIFPVLLFLSLITNNIVNSYSAAFGIQLIGVPLAKVPRFIWAIFITAVYLIAALVGRNHFSDILSNFLPMIGYWTAIYFMLLVEEDLIFRSKWFSHLYVKENEVENDNISRKFSKKQYYNWTVWNDFDTLTHGYAAIFSSFCGVAGAVVGMNQTYYVGPVAALVGNDGGDLGMWLSMAFAGAVYPWLRYLELKFCGR